MARSRRLIEVFIVKDDLPLAKIEIRNESKLTTELADYSVKYAVERGSAVGLHNRWINSFPRKQYNVLALVRQALLTLEAKELKLERDFDPDEATVSTDMARRLGGALREIQARFSRLHRD